MHELGVLYQALKTVNQLAVKNHIPAIKFITLEVGEESGYIPAFFKKLYSAAADTFPIVRDAQLRIQMAAGKQLLIKEIGY